MNQQKNTKLLNWLIFSLLCIIWGSSFIIMKGSQEGLNAVQIASLRIFAAGAVLIPFAIFHFAKIPLRKMPLVILSSVFGNLLPAFLFAAAIEKNIDSSLAAILNSLTPICVVVIGAIFFRTTISNRKILGVLLGFLGLCLLFSLKGVSFENMQYALWVVLGTVFYGINVNLVSKYLKDVNPLHLTSVSLAFMCIPTFIVLWQQNFLSLPFDDPVVQWSVIGSIILGIVGSAIATWLFYVLVKNAGGLFASLVTYGIPFVAIGWGLVFGENITLLQVGCLGIILGGVYLANR